MHDCYYCDVDRYEAVMFDNIDHQPQLQIHGNLEVMNTKATTCRQTMVVNNLVFF